MSVKYLCRECAKEHDYKTKICICGWPIIKKIIDTKKENLMTKQKALTFVKSLKCTIWNRNKPLYNKLIYLYDFIKKWVPEDNQEKLF